MATEWGSEPDESVEVYPPQGEDAELPWLPGEVIPDTEPEAPGLGMPEGLEFLRS